jgi:hypothetical protein
MYRFHRFHTPAVRFHTGFIPVSSVSHACCDIQTDGAPGRDVPAGTLSIYRLPVLIDMAHWPCKLSAGGVLWFA